MASCAFDSQFGRLSGRPLKMARRLHFRFIGMVFSIGPMLILCLIAQTYASFHDVLRDNNKRPTHLGTVPNTESGEIKKLSQALYNI